ncbi:MAG TPA: diacylglycerol kinase [Gammaproteobacteria bacterium]|nr:diacylglycerol kinase [Gammaproteobacteria bacterium]
MSGHSSKPENLAVIPRLWRAFRWSLAGIRSAYRHEQSFRIEIAAFPAVILFALLISDSIWQGAIMIGGWLVLLAVELLNSGIEAAIDRISADQHPLSGRAKDVGSAAVLMLFLANLLLWIAALID